MAKAKTTVFFCKECGFESSKWLGQCPACKEWNTLVEEPVAKKTLAGHTGGGLQRYAGKTCEAGGSVHRRSGIGFHRISGTGPCTGERHCTGSLVLVGGDPGIGKSTLLLQMCRNLPGMGTGFYTFPARNL